MNAREDEENSPRESWAGKPAVMAIGLGCLLLAVGFAALAVSPPAGGGWRSALATMLLAAGYMAVGAALWPAAPDGDELVRAGWLGPGVFLGTFAAYLWLLYPGQAPFISSEMAAAGATLGIPHMPGYPTYVLLFKLFSFLVPMGNVAYRENVGNALVFAVSNAIFLKLLLILLRDRVLAVLGAGIFFGAHALVVQALAAETVCLDILVVLLMIRVALGDRPAWPLLGFLFGAGLGGHHTIALLGPAFGYVALRKWGSGARELGLACLMCLLGLSVYLYVPIRSRQNPVVASDKIDSVASFAGFLTRKGLGTFHYAPENVAARDKAITARLADAAGYVGSSLVGNYTVWGLVCAVVGSLWLLARYRVYGVFLLLFFGVGFVVMGALSGLRTLEEGSFERATFDRIAALWYPALCLWLAAGCRAIADAAQRWGRVGESRGRHLARLLCLPPLVASLAPLPGRYNYRKAFYAHDYIRNISRSLPQRGLLLFPGDIAFFGSLYFQHVEGRRPEAGFLHQSMLAGAGPRWIVSRRWPEIAPREPGLPLSDYVTALARSAARRGHPVLVEPHSGNMSSIDASSLELEPWGMFKAVEGGRSPVAFRQAPFHFLVIRDGAREAREHNPFVGDIFVYYAGAHSIWGDHFARNAQWGKALEWYRRALLRHEHHSIAYKMAWALLGTGQQDSAEYWFKRSIALDRRFGPAYRDLAALYHKTGRQGEAALLLETAARQEAEDPFR